MKRSKGMTLVELLIAMGISVLIMAATVVIVRFSAATYDDTAKMVRDNNNSYDAVSIINHYIRTSYYCALSPDGTSLYVTVDEEAFGGNAGDKHTVLLAYDAEDQMLYIDTLDYNAYLVVSRGISRIEWSIKANGVKYTAYKISATGAEEKMFSGYAYKRGR